MPERGSFLRFAAAAAILQVVILLAARTNAVAETPGKKIEQVNVKAGQDAVGGPGDRIRLEVEFLGPHKRGILGGKGDREPVSNQPVVFSLLDGSASDASLVGAAEAVTDAGGKASCAIQLGKQFGDHYIEARAVDAEGEPHKAMIRVISGVKLFGNNQEGSAGTTLAKPLALQVLDSAGKPVKDVPVFFSIEGQAPGAAVTPNYTVTDKDGMASAFLKLPNRTEEVRVMAEVADPERQYITRGISFHAMSVNTLLLILTLIGGLALFIYGMKQMSDGLQKVAGERMKLILRTFTKNRFVGIATGVMVTGIIQSSSACTVMTVGFVNAGLITLRQAIGVVFGANIGTTVTGQIISFKLSDMAYPAIAAGLLMIMVSRSRVCKAYGEGLLGFGMLFLGITIMADTLKPLHSCPSFVALFKSFDCAPVNGVMPIKSVLSSIFIGTAMTVMIQSSSATVGLTMALAGAGMLNFWTSVPIILGDNIGTTTTALLASIGTNRAARRTAIAHSLFNVFGACYMTALFYVPAWWGEGRPIYLEFINTVTSGNAFAGVPENIERHIANSHTMFNVCNTIIFIPLVGLLERVCTFIVPIAKEEEEQKTYLEPHLLNQPSIALEQVVKEIGYMANLSNKAISESYKLMRVYDPRALEKLKKREDNIDRLQAEITSYLASLAQHSLTEEQSKMLAPLMHAVNDAERIGDHAENLSELAELRYSKRLPISDSALDELDRMFNAIHEQFANVIKAIEARDPSHADKALKLEDAVNKFDHELHDGHVRRMETGSCNAQTGVIFLDMVANLEKVGDHLTNIAERMRLVMELGGKKTRGAV